MTKGKKVIASSPLVDKTLGSKRTISIRFNPFKEDLPLDEILSLEEKGVLIVDDDANLSLTDLIVRSSLDKMGSMERKLIIYLYFDCLTLVEVAKKLGRNIGYMSTLKKRVMNKFKRIVNEERKKAGLLDAYRKCVVCNSGSVGEVNEFIVLWLESTAWDLRGLASKLKVKYDIAITVKELEEHVKLHIGLFEDNKIVLDEKEKDKISVNVHKYSLSVSQEDKESIDRLSKKYGETNAAIIRLALRYGLKILEPMFEINEQLIQELGNLAKFMRRVK